jgi:hypothetical protein
VVSGLALAVELGAATQPAEALTRSERQQIARECLNLATYAVWDFGDWCTIDHSNDEVCDGATCYFYDPGVQAGIDNCADCLEQRLGWDWYHALDECKDQAYSDCQANDWDQLSNPYDSSSGSTSPDSGTLAR